MGPQCEIVCPLKTRIRLHICIVLLEFLLSTWRNFGPLALQEAPRKYSDQTAWLYRLIWVCRWMHMSEGEFSNIAAFMFDTDIARLASVSCCFMAFLSE